MAIVFPWFLPLCFDISINIHEYGNEMSFILTISINIFVIYGITGAITSCHNDSFFLPENCLLVDCSFCFMSWYLKLLLLFFFFFCAVAALCMFSYF